MRGILTRPGWETRGPAILYAHAHGGADEIGAGELVDGRSALLSPLGPVLAKAGYVALCIDMPTFGGRATVTESPSKGAALVWTITVRPDAFRTGRSAHLPGEPPRRRSRIVPSKKIVGLPPGA